MLHLFHDDYLLSAFNRITGLDPRLRAALERGHIHEPHFQKLLRRTGA